ncbi:MAG: hypothetical protein M1817_004362 [Caeruleum heppii]|nr:MAG: hypothetical protein M1817_004362 [Caeruleum heppii]
MAEAHEVEKNLPHEDEDQPSTSSLHSSSRSGTSPRPSPAAASRQDATPELTKASSVLSRTTSIIPRSKRRGLFGQLTVLPEIAEPHAYTRRIKWFITFVIAMAATAAPMGSAILFPALPQLSADLNITPTISNLSVALYMLSLSIFPLWWSSFSETLGRRTIYLVSFALFVLFNVLCAVSSSVSMLIVMRVLVGGSSASVQAVGAGTIADIWEVRERGQAMGIFYLGPLCGPLFAPIIGGALAQKWGWRSTQWFLAIWGGVISVLILFCLPETLQNPNLSPTARQRSTEKPTQQSKALSRVTTGQSVQQKTKNVASISKRVFLDPLKIILYLRYPAVLITVYYASITFGSLYVLSISIQATFSKIPYNFSTFIVGLLYIPPSLGYILASVFGGRWTDRIMHREARAAGRYDENNKLIFHPEDRMRENAWLAAMLYPAAMLWYGWTADKGVYWLAPMIANFFFGIGTMLIFAMATTMLTEFMPKKSSAGVAVNNFVRNIFAAVGGVVTAPLLDRIGNGWLFTMLGVIAFLSSGVVWAMRRFGPGWRKEMEERLT